MMKVLVDEQVVSGQVLKEVGSLTVQVCEETQRLRWAFRIEFHIPLLIFVVIAIKG